MKLWLLTYTGKKRWNVTTQSLVRAADEAAARLFANTPVEEWTIERVTEDGPEDTIIYAFTGDPG